MQERARGQSLETDENAEAPVTATSPTPTASSSEDNAPEKTTPTSRAKPRPRARYSKEHRVLLAILVEARKASGLSQKALSARLGKALSHMSFIESVDRDLTFVEVARICDIVGLPLTELAQIYVEKTGQSSG